MRNRSDSNQATIVEFFRKAGASVGVTSQLGKGFPDLVIGYQGFTVLVEIKTSSNATLTPDQVEFHQLWRGNCVVVHDENTARILLEHLGDDRIRLTTSHGAVSKLNPKQLELPLEGKDIQL